MLLLFFLKCFVIGIAAASAIGPIFVLTFNSGATHGFTRGFFTALGAALGDGFLLFLGLLGTLSVFGSHKSYQIIINLLGGTLLVIFGLSMIITHHSHRENQPISLDSIITTVSKTFFSTILNPLTIFFFMFISNQILNTEISTIYLPSILMGSFIASLGSLLVLTIVTYIASSLGNAISITNLRRLSWLTGIIVMSVGVYFCVDALQILGTFK